MSVDQVCGLIIGAVLFLAFWRQHRFIVALHERVAKLEEKA